MADWYYLVRNEQKGPVPKDFILDLARGGQLQRTDLVWTEGMKDWLPAESVPELGIKRIVPPAGSAQPTAPSFPNINIQNTISSPILKTSGLAVASLVMGILGVLSGWFCCGLIFPILAIIFGHMAYSQINRQPNVLSGRGMAITGFILGYISLVVSLIIIFVFGVFSAIMDAASKHM